MLTIVFPIVVSARRPRAEHVPQLVVGDVEDRLDPDEHQHDPHSARAHLARQPAVGEVIRRWPQQQPGHRKCDDVEKQHSGCNTPAFVFRPIDIGIETRHGLIQRTADDQRHQDGHVAQQVERAVVCRAENAGEDRDRDE